MLRISHGSVTASFRRSSALAGVAATFLMFGTLRAHAQTFDPVYDAAGPGSGRTMLSLLPFEHVDAVTGNVFLSFTDLSLPGPAGFDLNFVRTYNSADGKWRFGLAGVPLIYHRSAPCCGSSNMFEWTFDLPTGAVQKTPYTIDDPTFTRAYWRFSPSTNVLELPNGLVATFTLLYDDLEDKYRGRLTELKDAFGNTVSFDWDESNTAVDVLQSVTQQLGGASRVTERSNPATEERFKTGQAAGGVSIV